MDDGCGGFGPRDWGCYCEQPPYKNSLGLQLMSNAGAERGATKGFFGYGGAEGGVMPTHPSFPVEFSRESWFQQRDKFAHMIPSNHHPNYALIPPDSHINLQMVPQQQQKQQQQQLDLHKEENHQMVLVGEDGERKNPSPRKRPAGRSNKTPKPKKPKKACTPKVGSGNGSVSRGKPVRKSLEMIINGVDLDISALPAPVCTCTGAPQQCYRWGIGGWQSACCTTSISMYPLPMSQKRRGARIAGRKMSQGAFKKVLEKLISEDYNLSDQIDLRPYWAKHGTNKFVTIR